jgi:hypothetical protein
MWAWWMSRSMSAAATIASPRISPQGLEAAVAGNDDRAAARALVRDALLEDLAPAIRRIRGTPAADV